MREPDRPIALALSGGGIRAMVFHLGVLRRLAERQLLERVARLSTVSGGSLIVGLLLQLNHFQWPSSRAFLADLLPELRVRLCARSLQWGAARRLLNPLNLRFALSRANLLAECLRVEWSISARLSALPRLPEWSINGTTAETGKRFRFKRDSVGDYSIGYADGHEFPLADALAVSAAFPGGFGPLTVDTRRFQWRKRPAWDAPSGSEVTVTSPHAYLHLYDGGVYDNLGLEPFFDAGRLALKHVEHELIVSDAGAPLASGFALGPLNVFRLKRVADIMSDQSRALRVRTLSTYLQQTRGGAYLGISMGVSAQGSCQSAEFAATFPTTLRRLSTNEFDRLLAHGHGVAVRVETEFGLCTERSSAG